ncbi:Eco47II family restriction endonuclease [Corynebacterium dentalis]|uniref:Eco47II family restriction endonuclease n=1 Tax=Corynebacterium dentalis TaxID=2014528 RepID=UPI00289DFDAB|nr:Eco47II family restriction endonuclease [Corynebacterium dentalis]
MNGYHIEWIPEEKFREIVNKTFANSIRKINEGSEALSAEPTLVLILSSFLDLPYDKVMQMLKTMSRVKTLQNAIGDFHQEILGQANGWINKGTSGGVFDIESKEPVALAGDRIVVAEVKMRFNTIKGVDEKETYDKLKQAVSSRGGGKKSVAYLIQIVPRKKVAYDKPWVPSGRTTTDYVRCIDGRTGYHLVTGDPNAFDDVMHALPVFLREAFEQHPSSPAMDWSYSMPESVIDLAINNSIPQHSFFPSKYR